MWWKYLSAQRIYIKPLKLRMVTQKPIVEIESIDVSLDTADHEYLVSQLFS